MKKTLLFVCLLIAGAAYAQDAYISEYQYNDNMGFEISEEENESGYMPYFYDGISYNVMHVLICNKASFTRADISQIPGCTETATYSHTQNATFNDREYRFFEASMGFMGEVYLREDTLTGTLYRYYPQIDTEVVICTMNLSVGDTFYMPDLSQYPNVVVTMASGYPLVVDSVFYRDNRKTIRFERGISLQSPFLGIEGFEIEFIEGIGPTYGPMGDLCCFQDDLGMLLCVHIGDSLKYIADQELGCYVSKPPVSIEDYENGVFEISPNPVANLLNIDFTGEGQPGGRIFITNVAGSTVYKGSCADAHFTVDVSKLTAGVYILRFENKDGKVITNKFVKM